MSRWVCAAMWADITGRTTGRGEARCRGHWLEAASLRTAGADGVTKRRHLEISANISYRLD
jgi:hypothetical protein